MKRGSFFLVTVFSAHAEVVPTFALNINESNSILRARGGSSYTLVEDTIQGMYSPRTRR